MGKLGTYIKRGIKYVLYDYRQPIIKVSVFQKAPTNIFKDKVYIVTGGGSGLGFYITKKIISENGKVIIIGRNEEKLKIAKEQLGDNCDYFSCDIRNLEEMQMLIKKIFDKYKYVDGLVNNAAISLHEWDFMKVDSEKFDIQFLTNLKASYFLTQNYIKEIRKQEKEGNVIFISSEAGTLCDDLPYGLTKASINSLVKALSTDYYKYGIRINAVAPGITATDMTHIDKSGDLYMESNSERIFVPEEVAEVVCFILSDYSNCISGEVIHTNGGNHIKKRY